MKDVTTTEILDTLYSGSQITIPRAPRARIDSIEMPLTATAADGTVIDLGSETVFRVSYPGIEDRIFRFQKDAKAFADKIRESENSDHSDLNAVVKAYNRIQAMARTMRKARKIANDTDLDSEIQELWASKIDEIESTCIKIAKSLDWARIKEAEIAFRREEIERERAENRAR